MSTGKITLGAVLAAAGCASTPPPIEELAAARAAAAAQYRSAEAEVAMSSNQRNRVLLEAREREAAIAKEQARAAELARAEAERRAQELGRSNELQKRELQKRELQKGELQKGELQKGELQKNAGLTAELNRLRSQISDLKAQQTERGWVLTLRNELLFDAGGATLKPGGQRVVENLAQLMRRHPDREIAIEGFTDSAGSTEANRKLSESRAAAVKSALVARGIEPYRIDARGYGQAFPVASNETPTGRQLNRRVEIVINPS